MIPDEKSGWPLGEGLMKHLPPLHSRSKTSSLTRRGVPVKKRELAPTTPAITE